MGGHDHDGVHYEDDPDLHVNHTVHDHHAHWDSETPVMIYDDLEDDNSEEYRRIQENIIIYAHQFCETLFPLVTILATACIYHNGYNEAYTDSACVFIFYQMVFINCAPYMYGWIKPVVMEDQKE